MAPTLLRAPGTRSAAFGLALELDAEIELWGLPPREASALAGLPVTRVRLDGGELRRRWSAVEHGAERVRELRGGNELVLSVDLAEPAGYLLHAPGFAHILVAPDGGELLCEPLCEGSEWTTLVLAQALPLAATLQGLEVLHASAVVVPGGGPLGGEAALFSGPQGAGKSSLAAALVRRGARLLADDTVAMSVRAGRLLAHPGPGMVQLRPAEHERLGRETQRSRAHADEAQVAAASEPVLGKHRLAVPVRAEGVAFGGLFLLERGTAGMPPLERIEQVDPLRLLATTFNLSVKTPQRLTRHLDLAGALAASRRVFRLRIQPAIDATQLADILLERLPEL
jgi:hypothetical protein